MWCVEERPASRTRRGSWTRRIFTYSEFAAPVLIVRPPGPLAERARDIERRAKAGQSQGATIQQVDGPWRRLDSDRRVVELLKFWRLTLEEALPYAPELGPAMKEKSLARRNVGPAGALPWAIPPVMHHLAASYIYHDTAQIHAKSVTMSEHEMEMDEGDDLYEPEEPKVEIEDDKKPPSKSEELEEGEEEDESGAMDEDDDDSVRITRFRPCRASLIIVAQDIDIITERKDGTKAAPPPYVFESRFDQHMLGSL